MNFVRVVLQVQITPIVTEKSYKQQKSNLLSHSEGSLLSYNPRYSLESAEPEATIQRDSNLSSYRNAILVDNNSKSD